MDNIDLAQDNMDLARLRRYDRWEAAKLLNINPRWLRDWVTADVVPHQRKGEVRGVWFSYDDIEGIGRMLPSLMSKRQANLRTEAPAETSYPTRLIGSVCTADVADGLFERFAVIRSLRASVTA